MQNLLAAPAAAQQGSPWAGLLVPVIFLAVFYFMVIRPQKKREKEITEMRDSIKVGDVIVTIGGLKGKVTKVGDDYITVETGKANTEIELTRWSVGLNETNQKKKED